MDEVDMLHVEFAKPIVIREFIYEVFLPMFLNCSTEFRQSVLSQVSVSLKFDLIEFI
jgi:hypothetical protein